MRLHHSIGATDERVSAVLYTPRAVSELCNPHRMNDTSLAGCIHGSRRELQLWRHRMSPSRQILLTAVICGVGVCSGELHAQSQLQRDSHDSHVVEPLEEVIVTGSLLPTSESESDAPVVVIGAEQIRRSGLTTVSDVVRSLTADNSGSLPTAFTGASALGASGVSLRGLTVNSTLVLIDGRRAAPYGLLDDGERSFVDLNTLPLNAVERIEVLKDGASSVYGADAIAGVVNVILEHEYQGAGIDVEVGKGQHPGGAMRRIAATLGTGDLQSDRYNAFIDVEFQGDDRILASDRAFPFNSRDLTSIGGFDSRAGQPGSFTGTTAGIVAPAILEPGASSPAILNTTQAGPYRPLNGCAGPGMSSATAPSAIEGATDTYCLQNRAVYNEDQPSQQRLAVTGRLTVALSETTRAYIGEIYAQNSIRAGYPPLFIQTPVPFNTQNIALPPTLPDGSLNPNNPFAAAGQYALIQYAFGDLPAQAEIKSHSSRTTIGLTGTLGDWKYDTAAVVNHTWLDQSSGSFPRIAGLLAAVTDGSYNFVDPGANSPVVRNALAATLRARATTDMDSIDFRAVRDVLPLPGGALSVGLGAEARYESLSSPSLDPDNSVLSVPIAQASGSRRVAAGYFEFGVPVLKVLNLDLSGRYDHYSDFGSAFAPKAGLKFTPFEWLTIRGTWSRGFRAPSFAEGSSSEVESFYFLTPTAGSPFPDSFCAPTYHSPAYCQRYLVGSLIKANRNIGPEKADTFTLGLVLGSSHGFSASVGFYAIKKTHVIEPPDTGPALAAYLNGAPIPSGYTVTADLPDPAFPASRPRPSLVSGVYVNGNSLRTDGLDIDLHGEQDFNHWGRWSSDLSVTKVFSFKVDFGNGVVDQYVGTQAPYILSSGAGTPRYRATWSNTYSLGPGSVTLSSYYVSGFDETAVDATGDPAVCLYSTQYCHVASFIDFDLTALYRITPRFTAALTVQNLMDRQPPIDPADYAGVNHNPTYHQPGIIGRYFKVGLSYRF
jgi:iron complex outermembrane recepter protein